MSEDLDESSDQAMVSGNDGLNGENGVNGVSSGGTGGQTGGREKTFVVKKWNCCAMWSWDCECDTCAICRVQVMDACL
ncbi:unnamed protein product, partial [Oppiella nova]